MSDLISTLKSKTTQAQQTIEQQEKKRQAQEKTALAKVCKKYIEESRLEASRLFDECQPRIIQAAENGANTYTVCQLHPWEPWEDYKRDGIGVRDQIISDVFKQAGFEVEIESREIPGTGHYGMDDGVWWADYKYYIRVKW